MGPEPDGLDDRAGEVLAGLGRGRLGELAAPVTVTFLGGLGEIGRNCACIEVDGQIVLLDCGLMFPDLDMLGIDLVLPDFTYLRDNADRIVGCIATHGHEDHVGGLALPAPRPVVPDLRLGAHPRRWPATASRRPGSSTARELIAVADGERRQIGPFDVEFIPVTHSVPHGFATAFHTPAGRDPPHRRLQARPHAGRRPAHRPGPHRRHRRRARASGCCCPTRPTPRSPATPRSERRVGEVLYDLFHEYEGRRIITACFASHIHRIQQIADAAIAFDRTVATLGLSMKKNVRLAREMGLLHIPDDRAARHRGDRATSTRAGCA